MYAAEKPLPLVKWLGEGGHLAWIPLLSVKWLDWIPLLLVKWLGRVVPWPGWKLSNEILIRIFFNPNNLISMIHFTYLDGLVSKFIGYEIDLLVNFTNPQSHKSAHSPTNMLHTVLTYYYRYKTLMVYDRWCIGETLEVKG